MQLHHKQSSDELGSNTTFLQHERKGVELENVLKLLMLFSPWCQKSYGIPKFQALGSDMKMSNSSSMQKSERDGFEVLQFGQI